MSDSAPSLPVSVPQGMVRLMLTVATAYADVSRSLGLTSQQAQLLCAAHFCAAQDRSAIGDLAAFMRCERSSVSHLVERAAGRGYLERRGTESDGRVKVVELSREGEAVVQKFMAALEARLAGVVADWPKKRRSEIARTLNELATGLIDVN